MFYYKLNIKVKTILACSFIFIFVIYPFTSIINAQTENRNRIRLGSDLWVPTLVTYIAQEKGYFKENNVDVNLTLFHNYGDAINAIFFSKYEL
jgi:ABC-type nitrate/sulfonate/bicarbonate transport system substrate-binding protein